MGHRRKARELALQALYYLDMNQCDSEVDYKRFCINFPPSKNVQPFLDMLVKGVLQHRSDIDALIERHSRNWKVSRMSCVDRNVLRIAVYELLYCPDIPSKVTINEAVDVVKKFGTVESGAFINGIIDSIRKSQESGS